MLNGTTNVVTNLQIATFWINRIIPPLQIVFGTFGNSFNIIVFTRRALRTNPCSLYFLVGSINNIFVLYVALLSRYLAASWNFDPSARNNILCKLRFIFVYSSISLTLWITVLASIDRFLSSSDNLRLRRLSSIPIARKMLVFTIIFIFLIHSHILILFKSGMDGNVIMCTVFSYEYFIFMDFFLVIVACFLPIILTVFFGILMIVNVRNSRNRVVPQVENAYHERMHSNDRQLITMLLFQVLITILFTAPFTLLTTYSLITIVILKNKFSTLEQAIFSFVSNLFLIFYYTTPVVGFYIYTLTGSRFRAEMKRCIQYALQSVLGQCSPLRTQRTLINENQMGVNNAFTRSDRRENVIPSIQHHKSRNMTSAV